VISKNKIKELRLLHTKKGREKTGCFLVEGDKMVKELISSDFGVREIVGLTEWRENITGSDVINLFSKVNPKVLKQISTLKTPNKVIAVAQMKDNAMDNRSYKENLIIAVESLQDPGNFGTILRIANWFGIGQIVCSHDTVDVYNSKVIQASMGAIFRVNVHYTDLASFIQLLPKSVPIFGTFLNGQSIYASELTNHGVILFGNESKGISDDLAELVKCKFKIPSYPPANKDMESLNVSSAVGITIAEFRRQTQTIQNEMKA
jgi:TrmH family RNA methyltransferase